MSPLAARVHILLAPKGSKALIIRRYKQSVCTILWDTKKDTFKPGECYMKIFERLSDISPCGEYIYYVACSSEGHWFAISKSSSLRDMVLYGDDREFGSARMPSTNATVVDELYSYFTAIRPFERKRANNLPPRYKNVAYVKKEWDVGRDTTVYYRRLIRDGWTVVNHVGSRKSRYERSYKTYFQKKISNNWVIQKISNNSHKAPQGVDGHWDEHEIINTKSKNVIGCQSWDWAEIDGNDMVWTQGGCLYRLSCISFTNKGYIDDQDKILLCDLNRISVDKKSYSAFNINGDIDVLRGCRLEERRSDDHTKIIEHYLTSIEGGGIDACFYLSKFFVYKTKDLDGAKKYVEIGFDRVKKAGLTDYWHYDYLGDVLYKREEYEKCITVYEDSISLTDQDYDRANSYNYIGVSHYKMGNKAIASGYFKKAMTLNPTIELYQQNFEDMLT